VPLSVAAAPVTAKPAIHTFPTPRTLQRRCG